MGLVSTVTALTPITTHLPRHRRRRNAQDRGNRLLILFRFLKGINLISLLLGQLVIPSHKAPPSGAACDFDYGKYTRWPFISHLLSDCTYKLNSRSGQSWSGRVVLYGDGVLVEFKPLETGRWADLNYQIHEVEPERQDVEYNPGFYQQMVVFCNMVRGKNLQ